MELHLVNYRNDEEFIMLLKKLAIVSIASLGMSGLTHAAEPISIDGTHAKPRTEAYTVDPAAASFVVTTFEYTVSSNVAMVSLEDTVAFAVGTASQKGRNAYTGSSNGGAVTPCGPATTGADVPPVPTLSLDPLMVSGCTQ